MDMGKEGKKCNSVPVFKLFGGAYQSSCKLKKAPDVIRLRGMRSLNSDIFIYQDSHPS
jgi:hypothetical protein